jgi:hypothetical protein
MTVRLSKEEALQVMGLVQAGSLEDGERMLRAMRPDLDAGLRYEVAMRCGDPARWGGTVTGHDPEFGDYLDVKIPIPKKRKR